MLDNVFIVEPGVKSVYSQLYFECTKYYFIRNVVKDIPCARQHKPRLLAKKYIFGPWITT